MTKLILSLAVLSVAALAHASPVDAYEARESAAYNKMIASMAQPGGVDQEFVTLWCDRQNHVLDEALANEAYLLSIDDKADAFKALENGLYKIVSEKRQFPEHLSPYVKVAANEALLVAYKFKQKNMGSDLGAINTLESLVRNTRGVASKFDTDYYIQFRYEYRGIAERCPQNFVERMQAEALSFAAGQMRAALASAQIVKTSEGPQYRPIGVGGSAVPYLIGAEVLVNSTAQDLISNIFAAEMPCTIRSALNLGQHLANFNSGNRSRYEDAAEAVNRSGHKIADIANRIDDRSYSCSYED